MSLESLRTLPKAVPPDRVDAERLECCACPEPELGRRNSAHASACDDATAEQEAPGGRAIR
jgi:hypothetical protein